MTRDQEAKLKKAGIFKLEDAQKIGVSQPALSRLVKQGKINRVGRGIYVHPKANVSTKTGEGQTSKSHEYSLPGSECDCFPKAP